MRRRSVPVLALSVLVMALVAAAAAAAATSAPASGVEIPFQRFVLPNGLTLIVHEDHKAPIVAVNVWYHVGSKNEKPGRTGFAHLFEHLMFNGSENFNDDYFKVLERIGATDLNGTTNEDRTNYFQNVPVSALDTVLWMESDRMGHLIGAVDQAKLDEQRGVVQNEKRQFENQPYSLSEEAIARACFPAGHPYSWTVIGSMEDLAAAKVADAHEWFQSYYGAANAVIAVAGDVDPKTVKERAEKYFGDVPPGPPVARHSEWIARRTGVQRQTAQDRVPQARLDKVWNVPGLASADSDLLGLAAHVLSSGKSSRLYKRLVYDDQTATSVQAFVDEREIAGLFRIRATAKPGGDLGAVEKAMDAELARFLKDGPTEAELQRAKTEQIASFVRGVERIGGFGGKSDILARGEVYAGDPTFYKKVLGRLEAATPEQVRDAAVRWLSDGVYVLEIHPFPSVEAAKTGADRSRVPEPGPSPAADFPAVKRTRLSNGLEIVVAERHAVPVVGLNLVLDAGYAADQFASPGTASLTMAMLEEGTATRTALQISDESAALGAEIDAGSDLDTSVVSVSALKSKLDASLALWADVALNPSFPQEELDRLKQRWLAQIQAEKSQPFGLALRVFPRLLYGEKHAYATPFTGSGYESTVTAMRREDLRKFHATWFRPNRATVIVVGDTTMEEIRPKLEGLFKGWEAADVPAKNLRTVPQKQKSEVYLVDRPGSVQSIVLAGHVAPPRANKDEIAIEAMNTILGGNFVSRINMNLREDKHWSYGAGSAFIGARGQRPFLVYSSVQTDKTAESLAEIAKELRGPLGSRPFTDDELGKAKEAMTLQLPGSWETANAVSASIGEIVRYGLPEDWFARYAGAVRGLRVEDLARIARQVLQPERVVWVVVGDRSKVEEPIRKLGLGEIRVIDADGNPI